MKDKGLLKLLAIAMGGLIITTLALMGTFGVEAQTQGEPIVIAASVIKTGSNGQWYVFDDNNHASFGITSLAQDSQKVRVHLARSDYETSHVSVEEDETFVRLGYNCGGSGGQGYVDIYCTKVTQLNQWANPSSIKGTYANVWFQVEGVLYE